MGCLATLTVQTQGPAQLEAPAHGPTRPGCGPAVWCRVAAPGLRKSLNQCGSDYGGKISLPQTLVRLKRYPAGSSPLAQELERVVLPRLGRLECSLVTDRLSCTV